MLNTFLWFLQGISFICHICSKKVSDEKTLEMHIENTHLKTLEERERKFQCQVILLYWDKVAKGVIHKLRSTILAQN